ncbi:unnamed protein product [Thlaspi arvense]|uniref:ferric-chelate reductase (NADH) n=1 Tax=Thlaspi arvense TaxID=13288 RepID=A0AAU9RF28_THLAR|nr:unnamed protein product [Thlaspi arvense]
MGLGEINKGVIMNGIILLTMMILMGNLVIWIMMPTSPYKKIWLTSMRAKLGKSIYFGKSGVNLLIYMFPMILLACLGCIYLHLKKQTSGDQFHRSGRERKKRDKFGSLRRRPMFVKGPLGIVTATEVMFLTMFMALLLWSLTNHFYYTFVNITPQSAAIHGDNLTVRSSWEHMFGVLVLSGGAWLVVAGCNWAYVRVEHQVPYMARPHGDGLLHRPRSLLRCLLDIRKSSLPVVQFDMVKLFGLISNFGSETLRHNCQLTCRTGVSNLAGEIAIVAGLVMWATTYPTIRRRFFEVFFYTHYLYIVFMLFFVFHVGISYSLISFPGFYIFIVDRFLRFLQSRNNVKLVSARVLPCDTVELSFSKNPLLTYSPTSILFVNIPSISKLQWHPFTITSSSKLEPEKLSVMIKGQGIWSTKLYQMLSSSEQINRLTVSVEGPYGPTSTDFSRHESLVMVSGGSGITPFISIIRDLLYTSSTSTCKIPKMTLICAFKNSSDLSMLDLILPISGSTTEISSSFDIQIKAFVTREKESTTRNRNIIKSLCFKPYVSDQPISPVLGPNSWLCLATILSSSFIIFIIIIGFITRYHIYPIDQSSKYTSASKSIIYLLAISVSVVATSTFAVLCYNQNKYYTKNAPNVDVLSSLMMESSPQQLLSQSTSIHYGEKPDLNKLIVGSEGSSVGVLVCGPRKMRQEVAKICSFGSAENLRFESISFSW